MVWREVFCFRAYSECKDLSFRAHDVGVHRRSSVQRTQIHIRSLITERRIQGFKAEVHGHIPLRVIICTGAMCLQASLCFPGALTKRPKIVVCPRPWPQTMLGRSNPLALPVFSTSTWPYLLATSLHPFYKMDAPKLTLTVFFLRGICNLMPKSSKP